MKKILFRTFVKWLPLAVAIAILTGLVYVAVQQSYRMSANDPQIQISEDVADVINKGTTPDQIVPPEGSTDISKSLATFVIIYDDTGKAVGSTAILDGKTPLVPSGVLDFARQHGNDKFTWQPKTGVRVAAVVARYSGKASGFVLVGRSLREIEIRITKLGQMSAMAGLLALVLTYLIIFLFFKRKEKPQVVVEKVVEEIIIKE